MPARVKAVRMRDCHCGGAHSDWPYHTETGCAETYEKLERAQARFHQMEAAGHAA